MEFYEAINENHIHRVQEMLKEEKYKSLVNEISPKNIKFRYNARNDRYHTPLTLACCIGNVEMVDLLINNGASLTKTDEDMEWQPIIFAIFHYHYDIVDYLLPLHKKTEGKDDILVVAGGSNPDIFDKVREYYPDLYIKDEQGYTPLDIAMESDTNIMYKHIKKLL